MKWLLLSILFLTASASAADVSGTWIGTVQIGTMSEERTFVFKVDGNKLTGESSSLTLGESVIEHGKVHGHKISFTLTTHFQGTDSKVNYKGKVEGDQITFAVVYPMYGSTTVFTAKRGP